MNYIDKATDEEYPIIEVKDLEDAKKWIDCSFMFSGTF
jgi:hypothetical protein